MNTLDIVFCVILGFLGLRGIFRGMIREVASILGLLLGFFLANTSHAELAPLLVGPLGGPGLANLVAYLGIFLGTVAAVFILAWLVRKILRLVMLGWLDSVGGGALGLFKGALLCSIIVMALTAFLPPKAEILTRSHIVPYVNLFNSYLSNALPKDMRDQFLQHSKELHKAWEDRVLSKLKEIKGSAGGKQ